MKKRRAKIEKRFHPQKNRKKRVKEKGKRKRKFVKKGAKKKNEEMRKQNKNYLMSLV